MIVALVMIRCERDQIPEAARSIVEFPGVEEVYSVTGEWDLIVKVKVLHWEEIARVVTEHIAKVKGIQRTDTHMAFRVLSKDDMSATYEGFQQARTGCDGLAEATATIGEGGATFSGPATITECGQSMGASLSFRR